MDLAAVVGAKLGPGPWMEIDSIRLENYWKALGNPRDASGQWVFFLVSLLPALSAGSALPVPPPRATINYGLNRLRSEGDIAVGDRLRMTATVSEADWVGEPHRSPLQVVRTAVVENQRFEVVLSAETVTRLVF